MITSSVLGTVLPILKKVRILGNIRYQQSDMISPILDQAEAKSTVEQGEKLDFSCTRKYKDNLKSL